MELRPHWKLRWLTIAVLTIPTLVIAIRYAHRAPKTQSVLAAADPVQNPSPAQPASPWKLQTSATAAGLRGIISVDGKVAWASGTEGTVLRTVDGGEHWTKCAVPDGDKDGATLDFRGVQAWDANTAIVMASGPGSKSRLYKTVNGCRSWELLLKNENEDGFWDALRMWTPTDGFLAGDPESYADLDRPKAKWLFLSEFTAWYNPDDDSVFRNSLEAHPGESAFAASNSSIALAPFRTKDGESREVWFATGGPSGSRVIHYEHFNGGEPERVSYSESDAPTFPRTASGGIFSIQVRKGRLGIAVGGDYAKPNESVGTAARIVSGKTWIAATQPPHGYRSSVQWSESLKAWITVGTNGSDISRDDGKTWTPLNDPPVEGGNWNALSLPFVVGPKGRIARLTMDAAK